MKERILDTIKATPGKIIGELHEAGMFNPEAADEILEKYNSNH